MGSPDLPSRTMLGHDHVPLIPAVAEIPAINAVERCLPHLDITRETIQPEVEPLLHALYVMLRERVQLVALAIEELHLRAFARIEG